MNSLNALLKQAAHAYESRKAAAEAQVVRWEYWSGPAYDPKPYYFERCQRDGEVKRGKRVAKPSSRGCAYGFDSRGRVVIDRQPRSDEPAYDEFFIHGKTGIESAAYARDGRHELRYVTRQAHRNGRPISTQVLDAGSTASSFAETYRYRSGRLAEIVVTSILDREKTEVRYDLVYESDGRLSAIRREYDYLDEPYPIYMNLGPGETLEALSSAMQKRLVDLIPRTVAKAKIKQPAYCLALAYDVGNGEFPPILGVGLESERQRWLASGDRESKAQMWNPAEFSRYEDGTLHLTGPSLEEESQKLLQLILMKEALWVPRRILNAVSMELNKRSWKGILQTGDDFIVFAIDLEGDDFKKNLKEGVPAGKLKLLKSRKLL